MKIEKSFCFFISHISMRDKKVSVSIDEGREGGATPPSLARVVGLVLPTTPEPSVAPGEARDPVKARGICFTVFQYDSVLEKLRAEARTATYCVLGFEICPDTKRPHIQGYIHYNTQRSLKNFSKKFNNCHVEVARGTPKQAADYCKEDGKFEEFGELPTVGRKDWSQVLAEVKTGVDTENIIENQPHLAPYQRHIRDLKFMFLKPLNRDVTVIVLHGKGGTGKTRWAYDNYPDLYSKPVGSWWDGYTGQKTVLLDDYYGYIKYHELLTILDRYPLNLPYKGGYVWAQYDTVIITSNKHPNFWYQLGMTWPLRRRLSKIMLVESIDGQTHYTEETYPASEETWRSSHEETHADA